MDDEDEKMKEKHARIELIFVDVDANANINDVIKVLIFHLQERILLLYLLLIS
jgi:hypothetical protein